MSITIYYNLSTFNEVFREENHFSRGSYLPQIETLVYIDGRYYRVINICDYTISKPIGRCPTSVGKWQHDTYLNDFDITSIKDYEKISYVVFLRRIN